MLLKGFVVILFILDTVHTVLCIYSVYWYLILNFGNVANLDLTMWAINIQIDVNGLMGFLVQLMYARRVYIMSGNIVIPAIITALGGICFALGFVLTRKIFELKYFSRDSSLTWVICVGMGSTASADILIALSMCWYLYHKRTGFAGTDSVIMTLMSYSINSGLLTSILAIGLPICFVIIPTNFIWVVFFWLMGKCYVNSFLAMLNNRDTLRERPAEDDNSGNAFHLSSIRQNKPPGANTVGVHRTHISDFAPSKEDYNFPKLDKLEEATIMSVHEELPKSAV